MLIQIRLQNYRNKLKFQRNNKRDLALDPIF